MGGGQMGTGIAYVSSVLCALPVTLVDSRQSQLDSSRAMIRSLLDKDERKGKITAKERAEAERRFTFESQLSQVALPADCRSHSARVCRQSIGWWRAGSLVSVCACAVCVFVLWSARVSARSVHHRGGDGESGREEEHTGSAQR